MAMPFIMQIYHKLLILFQRMDEMDKSGRNGQKERWLWHVGPLRPFRPCLSIPNLIFWHHLPLLSYSAAMSKFPAKIPIPASVRRARKERRQNIMRASLWAISVRLLIIACEVAGVILFGSAALLMDALSSFIDVVFSLLLLLFIKIAARPPDANHPFGHGRYEPLAGLQLGLLLSLVGAATLVQQVWHLSEPTTGQLDNRAWMIPFGAVVLLEICYAVTMRVAKKHDSPALAADALHYRVDSLTSLFATIALIFAAYFPDLSVVIDHLGALAISLFMVVVGLYAVRKNTHQLLDTVPADHYFDSVRNAARSVAGVRDTEKIRIQLYGPDAHVDIDIEVDPMIPVEEAHAISQKVRVAIQREWPAVRDVIVHIEPYYPNDH